MKLHLKHLLPALGLLLAACGQNTAQDSAQDAAPARGGGIL